MTMKQSLSLFPIRLVLLCATAPALVSQGSAQPFSCDDHSIAARAVRTPEDVEAFVQCAHEFVQEMGFEEAYRAFHEDERWNSGQIYVFVTEIAPIPEEARPFVYPPDPLQEELPWGLLIDTFGNNLYRELQRVAIDRGEGWVYYSFPNPATGRDEPKGSYMKTIDWQGNPAMIGTGIYRRDFPGTCWSEEVNALVLEESPSNHRLQEFVRCAALELESKGYFATITLATDPRWRNESIYVFGLDAAGNPLFSGDPDSEGMVSLESELDSSRNASLQGQDVISVAEAFGETFLHYWAPNPTTGILQRKVAFIKRVAVNGLPILVGSGIYVDCPPSGCEPGITERSIEACQAAREMLADSPAMEVNYGFYGHFEPVSYSAVPVPLYSSFHQPLGYEPDLVAAVETFSKGKLSFNSLGIGDPFPGIWLKADQEPYDMVGGGITALPERTLDADGQRVIRFGVGHIRFRQSLLVRSESVIDRHDDLTSGHRVGVFQGTTGEQRLLELTGIIDAAGFLGSGTQVELADGSILVAGEPGSGAALRIAAGTGSLAIVDRVRLVPAGDDQPEILYFNRNSEAISALQEGTVDAVAGSEVGHRVTADDTPGLRVTAVDTQGRERGAFSYPVTPAGDALREAMNAAITCLTAHGTIGFSEWFDSNGAVFAERAEEWR